MVKWWERPFLTLDFETTGVDPKEARPLEVYAGLVEQDGTVKSSVHGFFDHGECFEIPESAKAVHGITGEKIRKLGTPAKDLFQILMQYLLVRPARTPIVIFNVPYDYQILLAEAPRLGVHSTPLAQCLAEKYFLDPLVIDRGNNRYINGPRKLGNVCRRLDVPLTRAHGAEADALASVGVCRKLLQTFRPTVSLEDYQRLQATWFETWKEGINAWWARAGSPQRVSGGWPL